MVVRGEGWREGRARARVRARVRAWVERERGLGLGSGRACDLTLEQKSCAKGGVRTAKRGVRTLGVRTAEKVLEHC